MPADRAEAYVNGGGDSDSDGDGGGAVDLMVFDGADHFDVIDPANESWLAVIERLKQEWG